MGSLTNEHFNHFFHPRSVAIVGASEKTGPGSYNLMENLLDDGCTARLFPVNIRAKEVLGHRAYRSVLEIPEIADLAVITLPRSVVLEAVRECVQKGIDSVIIVTQGFADADEEGRRMQEELEEIINGTGTRLIGPNSIGVANAFDKFHTSFQKFDLDEKANGMICQSGLFVLATADFTEGMGLGVDIGNGIDLGFTDFLPSMADDRRIKVINLHMEGLSDGRAFLEAATKITPQKPILVYKTGCSEEGAKAAASHSASLAGEDHVFDAAFRRAGIIRVQSVEELNDANKAFLTYPCIKGKRFAVITLTGGGGIAVIDALSRYELELASPGREVMEAIQAMNPAWLEVSNPFDTWMASLKKGLAKATVEILHLLLGDDSVDGAILLLNAYRATGFTVLGEVLEGIVEEARNCREKPIALWAFGANQHAVIERAERSGVVAGFTSPERAARALACLYHYHHRIKDRPVGTGPRLSDVNRERAAKIIRNVEKTGAILLGREAFEILEAYGIRTARAHFASDKGGVLSLGEKLGYPLVMKIVSPEVVHKSDVGGVELNIRDSKELEKTFDSMISTVRSHVPEARIEGVILQKYHPGGVEVIIGSKQDDAFGPVLLFGLGGIYTEIMKDVSFRLAPLAEREAREMIDEIKSKAILEGVRGKEGVDLEAVVDVLLRVSQLVVDFPQIKELDINPLAAGPDSLVALDARAVLGRER